MEERVKLELRGRKLEEIHQLNLDNCRSAQIEGVTEAFTSLEYLSIINVGLQTLKGFPVLPSLKRIDLSDNKLTNGLDFLTKCTNLTHVNVSGNSFADCKTLEPLKDLPNLKSVDIFGCPMTETADYRQKVFELIPHMGFLDGFDKKDNECSTSDSEFDTDDDEGEDVGLAYLQSSNAAHDEDETEDFDPNVEDEDDEDDDIDDEEDDGKDEHEVESESETAQVKGIKRKFEE